MHLGVISYSNYSLLSAEGMAFARQLLRFRCLRLCQVPRVPPGHAGMGPGVQQGGGSS